MRIKELIHWLEKEYEEKGDLELFAEQTDGRSTWAEAVDPEIRFREIWRGHSDGKRHFMSI